MSHRKQQSSTEPSLLEAALDYAKRGWPVFPCHTVNDNGICSCGKECSSPGKHPRTAHGLKDASANPTQLQQWWTRWPDANIGIPTGRVSNLLILDVDSEEARRTYEGWEPRSDTFTVRTGCGWQFYFAYPRDADIRNSASKLGTELDIRGEGGYVIAPPSRHYSGKRYSVLHDIPVAATPNSLLERLIKGTLLSG